MSNPNKSNEKKESKGLTFDEIQQIFVERRNNEKSTPTISKPAASGKSFDEIQQIFDERRNNEKATTGDNKEETHLFD